MGNKYIELLSTSNTKLMDQWKIHNGVKKEYDTKSKTYIYKVGGESPVVKMHFPKNKKKLDLYYPLLVLQLSFPIKGNILCNIGVISCSNQRKRITLSSKQKCKQNSSLFTVLPFTADCSNKWITVLVDVEEILSVVWKDLTLKEIDFLSLSGVFNLKRIFLISRELLERSEGTFIVNYDQLPRQMSQPKSMIRRYQYISSDNSSLVECTEDENSDVSSRSTSGMSSRSETMSNSSRNSSRLSFTIVSTLSSEVERPDLQDQNTGVDCPSEPNNAETFTTNYPDLNLSVLTFSEEMISKIQESDSRGIAAEETDPQ